MKTFLNVLYRRILYKIPLKFLLLLIAVFGILFFCFSSADNVVSLLQTYNISNISVPSNIYKTLIHFGDYISEEKTICFIADLNGFNSYGINIGLSDSANSSPFNSFNYWDGTNDYLCFVGGPTNYLNAMGRGSSGIIDVTFFILNDLLDTGLPVLSSLECQTEYNLIPVDSVDSEYCENNNLCSSSDCPIDSGDLTPGVSNIFINDIFHPGAFNIVMNIPQEIDWDYAYTNSGQNFNIDVVGYNVDYEKIQSVIDLQNYKPTDEDFSNIIGVLAPYSKIIIFFVVLFSLWAMLKKPFKSKKL